MKYLILLLILSGCTQPNCRYLGHKEDKTGRLVAMICKTNISISDKDVICGLDSVIGEYKCLKFTPPEKKND